MITSVNYLKKSLLLFVMGISMCLVNACDSDIEEPVNEHNEEETQGIIGTWKWEYDSRDGCKFLYFDKTGYGWWSEGFYGDERHKEYFSYTYNTASQVIFIDWGDYVEEKTVLMLSDSTMLLREQADISYFNHLYKRISIDDGAIDNNGNSSGGGDNEKNENVSGVTNGHEYVDLGLPSGTLWATMNVGATSPEDYGDYFAWGEVTGYDSGKTSFSWSNYKYCNGSSSSMTKYCTKSSYGSVDNKTELELSDDAARQNWGGSWRMPSEEQFKELVNECTWKWTTQNGVYGYRVSSKKNSNSLFFPAAGFRDTSLDCAGSYGVYWSRSLIDSYSNLAYNLFFYSSNVYPSGSGSRDYGQSVRPVLGSK